jgi:hypothetical protein
MRKASEIKIKYLAQIIEMNVIPYPKLKLTLIMITDKFSSSLTQEAYGTYSPKGT